MPRTARLFLIVSTTVSVVVASVTASAQGRLSVSSGVLDFGDQGQRARPRLTLTLTNSGDASLRILEMKPSCSCIQLRPATVGRALEPGAAVEISVSMGSGRAIGKLDKFIAIRNDGVQPRVRVATRMSVFSGLRQEPRELRFHGIVGGNPTPQSVALQWPTRSRPGGPGFSLSVVDVVAAFQRSDVEGPISRHFTHSIADVDGGKRITITALPSHPEGRIAATLRCRLDGKTLEIPIRGEMFRGIFVTQTSLNFNRVAIDDPATFVEETRLRSADGRPFEIRELEVRPAKRTKIPGLDLTITRESIDEGREWILRARISVAGPVLAKGSFSGKLRIATDHPDKPSLELGFFGFFTDPNATRRSSSTPSSGSTRSSGTTPRR